MIQDGWFQRHLPWLALISIRPYCALSNVLLMYFHKNTAVQHGHIVKVRLRAISALITVIVTVISVERRCQKI